MTAIRSAISTAVRRAMRLPASAGFADGPWPVLNLDMVNSATLDNRVTFSRGSGGGAFGSDGLYRWYGYNLLTYSQDFSNAVWATTATTKTSTNNPDSFGGNTALLLTIDSSVSVHNVQQTNVSVTSGNSYTASFYVKAGVADRLQVTFPAAQFSGAFYANFLLRGAGSVNSGGTGGSASIASVGSNWYRVVFTSTATASASITVPSIIFINSDTAARAPSFAGTTESLYISHAQLEQASTASSYSPTTTAASGAPRFDYDPVTLAPKGLLVEEQRTNFCLQSEDFTNASWTKTSITPTSNSALSPKGEQTADTLTATGANGTCLQGITTTAVSWTFSVYLKRLTGTGNVDITMDGTTWVTQTINSTSWTRCVVTQTGVAGTSNCGIRLATSGDAVYAWGAQAE